MDKKEMTSQTVGMIAMHLAADNYGIIIYYPN